MGEETEEFYYLDVPHHHRNCHHRPRADVLGDSGSCSSGAAASSSSSSCTGKHSAGRDDAMVKMLLMKKKRKTRRRQRKRGTDRGARRTDGADEPGAVSSADEDNNSNVVTMKNSSSFEGRETLTTAPVTDRSSSSADWSLSTVASSKSSPSDEESVGADERNLTMRKRLATTATISPAEGGKDQQQEPRLSVPQTLQVGPLIPVWSGVDNWASEYDEQCCASPVYSVRKEKHQRGGYESGTITRTWSAPTETAAFSRIGGAVVDRGDWDGDADTEEPRDAPNRPSSCPRKLYTIAKPEEAIYSLGGVSQVECTLSFSSTELVVGDEAELAIAVPRHEHAKQRDIACREDQSQGTSSEFVSVVALSVIEEEAEEAVGSECADDIIQTVNSALSSTRPVQGIDALDVDKNVSLAENPHSEEDGSNCRGIEPGQQRLDLVQHSFKNHIESRTGTTEEASTFSSSLFDMSNRSSEDIQTNRSEVSGNLSIVFDADDQVGPLFQQIDLLNNDEDNGSVPQFPMGSRDLPGDCESDDGLSAEVGALDSLEKDLCVELETADQVIKGVLAKKSEVTTHSNSGNISPLTPAEQSHNKFSCSDTKTSHGEICKLPTDESFSTLPFSDGDNDKDDESCHAVHSAASTALDDLLSLRKVRFSQTNEEYFFLSDVPNAPSADTEVEEEEEEEESPLTFQQFLESKCEDLYNTVGEIVDVGCRPIWSSATSAQPQTYPSSSPKTSLV